LNIPRTFALRITLTGSILTLSLSFLSGCNSQSDGKQPRPDTSRFTPNIQQVVNSTQLAILKWPNFADEQADVKKFYDARNDQLAWTINGLPTQQAAGLIQLFEDAALKGLNADDYDAPRWAQRMERIEQIHKSKDSSDNAQQMVAEFDAAMTITALRFLGDLHEGRINPETLNWDIDAPGKRAAFDVAGFLNDKCVDATNMPATVASVEPQNAMYRATENALPQYMALAKAQDAAPHVPLPPVTKTVEIGGAYPALAELAARLQTEGDAPLVAASTPAPAPANYDADLSAAVKHYQQRHGLTEDGKLTQATITSLNVPFDQRVISIGNALEHWRWMPDEYLNPRVMANLPEFWVRAYEPDHSLAFKMKIVDGQALGNHDTPVFVREMHFVIFRPYWNVPTSIVKKELVGHLKGDGGQAYLDKHNYEVLDRTGAAATGWTPEDLEHSKFLIRQKPGASNSLGLVKFLFPNEYDVYMHSTPEMNFFNLTRRDKSHGCIRLNDAEKMANWVLRDEGGGWTSEKIHDAMFNTDPTKINRQVTLRTTLAVSVTYLTATADEDGTMHFFDDIYGYDKQLDDALAKGRPYKKDPVKVNPHATPGETY
jgi:murein L,D-transpeptidase YcbB/YkuD